MVLGDTNKLRILTLYNMYMVKCGRVCTQKPYYLVMRVFVGNVKFECNHTSISHLMTIAIMKNIGFCEGDYENVWVDIVNVPTWLNRDVESLLVIWEPWLF